MPVTGGRMHGGTGMHGGQLGQARPTSVSQCYGTRRGFPPPQVQRHVYEPGAQGPSVFMQEARPMSYKRLCLFVPLS